MEGDYMEKRKIQILEAIIRSYIESGEPVGSRTLSKNMDIGVSSATIRNEMSDLEDLGYLTKAHLSSGRIPSDKAYRMYVDEILDLDYSDMKPSDISSYLSFLRMSSDEISVRLENLSKIISNFTRYTSFSFLRGSDFNALSHVSFSLINESDILAVLVYDDFSIDNFIISSNMALSYDEVNLMQNVINGIIKAGKSLSYNEIIKHLQATEMFKNKELIDIIIKKLEDKEEKNIRRVFIEGLNNILSFPEYADYEKAKNIISLMEDKEEIIDILKKSDTNKNIIIKIGRENEIETFKDCTILIKNMTIDDKVAQVGIIGPTRMDYDKIIYFLNNFYKNI